MEGRIEADADLWKWSCPREGVSRELRLMEGMTEADAHLY